MGWKNSQFRKKTTKAVKKRYGIGKGQGGFKINQVAKDLMYIKSRLNVEKKFINNAVSTAVVGQVNVNAPAYYAVDLLPTWVQGDGESQRVGNSLKLTGYNQKLQFTGMTNMYSTRRIRVQYIKTTDRVNSLPNILADIFDVNPLTGNIDYFSEKNYANSRKAHKIIRTMNYSIRAGSGIDVGNAPFTRPIGDMNCSLKLNDVLRFGSDADTSPQDYRLFCVIFVDAGNISGTASGNAGAMVSTAFTGLNVQWHGRTWYVDN